MRLIISLELQWNDGIQLMPGEVCIKEMFLGIDIGGSAIKYGWGNRKQGLLEHHRVLLQGNTLAAMQAAMEKVFEHVNNVLPGCRAIGIGTPGNVNIHEQKILGVNPNLPEWTNISPLSIIPDRVSLPAFADNDANVMTLAEASLIPHRTHVLGFTVGSGIGGGFIQNGHIYHGNHGYAMEIGHTTVVLNGQLCNCGRLGCVEAYCSVNGMRNHLRQYKPEGRIDNMQDILNLSKEDEYVHNMVQLSYKVLAAAISNSVILLDADAVIVGGGVIDLADYETEHLFALIRQNLPGINELDVVVKRAEMGNQAGTMGAVLLAEDNFYQI